MKKRACLDSAKLFFCDYIETTRRNTVRERCAYFFTIHNEIQLVEKRIETQTKVFEMIVMKIRKIETR